MNLTEAWAGRRIFSGASRISLWPWSSLWLPPALPPLQSAAAREMKRMLT